MFRRKLHFQLIEQIEHFKSICFIQYPVSSIHLIQHIQPIQLIQPPLLPPHIPQTKRFIVTRIQSGFKMIGNSVSEFGIRLYDKTGKVFS